MPLIPALRKKREVDHCECRPSMIKKKIKKTKRKKKRKEKRKEKKNNNNKNKPSSGVAQTFNPSTRETEAGRSL